MHILHLLSQTELTGAEVYAQVLIESQIQNGFQVSVISDQIHVPLKTTWTSMSISTNSSLIRMKNIWKLRQILLTKKLDVIHCHSRGAARHAYWARLGLPVAIVSTLHGKQHFSWSKRLMNIYGELQIAVCENIRLAVTETFKMSASPIRVLRNPIVANGLAKPVVSPEPYHLALIGRSSGPKGAGIEKILENLVGAWLRDLPQVQISIIASSPEKFSKNFQANLNQLQTQFPKRLHLKAGIPNLVQQVARYSMVIASGRIAAEALMARCSVLAIGEFETLGLVRLSNLSHCLQSNFGDIGSLGVDRPPNLPLIDRTVKDWIESLNLLSEADSLELARKVHQAFDASRICKEVQDIYRAAIFKRHVPKWFPILMYHKIPRQELQSRHRIFVRVNRFKQHLDFFSFARFQTLHFRELEQFWKGEKSYSLFPKKPLVLTFDDGYEDNLTEAQPLLLKYKMKANLFILGNHSIVENSWDSEPGEAASTLMNLQQKRLLDLKTWEIGSHGFDHLRLTEVDTEAAFKELAQSKLQLEKDFSQPICCFAYPFGSVNDELPHLAFKAGYTFAVNTDQGGMHFADNPRGLFRVNIFPEENWFSLWKKTSSWYRKYYFRKRGI